MQATISNFKKKKIKKLRPHEARLLSYASWFISFPLQTNEKDIMYTFVIHNMYHERMYHERVQCVFFVCLQWERNKPTGVTKLSCLMRS